MNRPLLDLLGRWPKGYIHDADLAIHLGVSPKGRYNTVHQALKEKLLVRISRGLYLIGSPLQQERPDLFELASQLRAPSYISLESSLAHHGWIPEAVYSVLSVTPKRARTYDTPLGQFEFLHTPLQAFHLGVSYRKDPTYLIAHPWKAIADIAYTRRKRWRNLPALVEDLRLDEEMVATSDLELLHQLSLEYTSPHVRSSLSTLLKKAHSGH